jgi:alkaline phosphatase
MKIKRFAAALVVALVAFVAQDALAVQAKNVILFIGDGMGPEHVEAARDYAGAPLSFEAFPFQGLVTTYSANSSIPDSASAGTAIATGVKVNNGVISVALPGDGHELKTLLEYWRDRGKSTGLVSTATMTDATPATFGAHEPSRNNTSNIAGDYLNQTRPDILFGGGGSGMSSSAAQAAGYTVVTDRATMQALPTNAVTRASGQFGSKNLPYEYDGLGALPHLSEMTHTALDVLSNDRDGFFLMVEGGLIDKAAHSNDLRRDVRETVEFSNAVQLAVNWASGRGDTLILVTADHETGGLNVTADNGPGNYPYVTWSTGGHTTANVPVYAWGFGAQQVGAAMNNTDFFGVATWSSRAGDANGDRKVDGADLALWQQNYDPLGVDNHTFYQGDWSGDGKVDGGDLALWQQNYAPLGYSSLPGIQPLTGRLTGVPEPVTLTLVALAGAAFVLRRLRRR